jgi:tripartite-type tricarboxylate transporter receptor subunit TctC
MRLSGFALSVAAMVALSTQAHAQQAVADFYRGKTITILFGGSPGGGYDVDARILARHIGRFIPGNPSLVVQNISGARGLTSVNRLYSTSPKDGTFMGVVQRGLLTSPWLNPTGVQFDVFKFNWLFSTAAEPGVAIVWKPPTKLTINDLRSKEVIIGGSGDSAIIPQVFNYTTGTKFKIIQGYPGTSDLVLAMERGEIQGIGYYSWSNIPSKNPTWLSEQKIQVLLQTGDQRSPELPDVPTVAELATDPGKRLVQDLWLSPLEFARPYAMPPETPKERVAAVQAAFGEMLKNSDFQEDAKKSGMVVDPRSADQIRALLNRIAGMPPSVIEDAKKAVLE